MVTFPAEIRTERLLLRPPTLDDAERMAMLADDPLVARNLSEAFPHPYTVDDARAFIPSACGMAVVTLERIGALEPGVVGMMGADPGTGEDEDRITFGYWLAPEVWGRGLATEAGRAMIDHLLTLDVRRIEALVYAWNPASASVLEKLGFEREGTMRNRVRRFGETTDEWVYGLLP